MCSPPGAATASATPRWALLHSALATRYSAFPVQLTAPNLRAGAGRSSCQTAVTDYWGSTRFPQLWLMLYRALPRQERGRGLQLNYLWPTARPRLHCLSPYVQHVRVQHSCAQMCCACCSVIIMCE